MARLFFACWPAEDAARELAGVAAALAPRIGGRPMPEEKIHLTLAFLGEVPDERRAAAVEAALTVRGRPFSFVLDRLGAFRKAGVAWAGAAQPDPALVALQGGLAAALQARGFTLEARPFAPHITLVRKVEQPLRAETLEPVRWRVTDFVLARTEPGTGRYAIVERWGLGN